MKCKLSNIFHTALLKEPILQDKRSEHIKFVKYCLELIASVTGAPVETTSLEDSVGNNLNKVSNFCFFTEVCGFYFFLFIG